MLKAQIIGVGAAGNKAALELINSKVVDLKDVMLVNSTTRDIPQSFKEHQGLVVHIGNDVLDGCGKQRDKGKQLALEAIQSNKLNLNSFINPDTDLIIIPTSTEGGTGSGASIIIADYIKEDEDIEAEVIMMAFTGFEEDPRSSKNTINFFKDLRDDYQVQIIRNAKFLSETNNDILKAEILANKEFAIRTSILLGNPLQESGQNIDRTDLLRTSTNYGYADILYKEVPDKIRNTSQFNEIVKEMIDNTKGMDVNNASQNLMATIINIPEEEKTNIDYGFPNIVDHYGYAYDKFKHIQSIKAQPTFIAFICTGMEIPIKEIEAVYVNYSENRKRVSTNKESISSSLSDFVTDDEDDIFSNSKSKSSNKNSFFKKYGLETPNVPKNNSSNKSVKSDKDKGMSEY
jgi:cell division GTPase FtsZ